MPIRDLKLLISKDIDLAWTWSSSLGHDPAVLAARDDHVFVSSWNIRRLCYLFLPVRLSGVRSHTSIDRAADRASDAKNISR